jgi:hypothetical protein
MHHGTFGNDRFGVLAERFAQVQHQEEFESQLRRLLEGGRRREDALQALLARQTTLIEERQTSRGAPCGS